MFSRDEIPENDRIQGSIIAIVRDVSVSESDKVNYRIILEDANGYSIPLLIWSTHELHTSLNEGHLYEISNVRGRYWSQDGTRSYQLDSTADLTITDQGAVNENTTRLLLVGDTHVGYRHRKQTDKVAGAENLDARECFHSVMAQADALDVDGVVHAGDIFDHIANDFDRSYVIDQLTNAFPPNSFLLHLREPR